jgi:hypothetical protein
LRFIDGTQRAEIETGHRTPRGTVTVSAPQATRSRAAFRPDVAEIDTSLEAMVWRNVVRLAELTRQPPSLTSALAYALIDGIFQQCLIKHVAGDTTAIPTMRSQVRTLFERL